MPLAPMVCQYCGAEFDHTNILKLTVMDELGESVRLVCPNCKEPGPVFQQVERDLTYVFKLGDGE
jgi:hypothetical protein